MPISIETRWPSSKIRDLCDISRGSSPRPICDQRYFKGGNIPWIKIADATKSGKYLYVTKEYVNEYGASFSRLLPAGTILVAASGTLGYTQILGVPGCAHDGWLILTNLRNFDRDYAYYVLQQMQSHFYNSAYGAAIQNINTEILRETEIPHPPLPTQRKIADILSAYDDLIENNTRRIKILEEMAQTIYREWFVNFRFPGHEKVKMVESEMGMIPDGWEVKLIAEYGRVVTGKTPSTTVNGNFSGDIPFLKTPDMHGNMFCIMTEDSLSGQGAASQKNKTLPSNSICVNCIGAGAGLVVITGMQCQTNQQINSVVLNNTKDREFLYFVLQDLRETIRQYGSNGATMINLNKGKFESLQTVYPSEVLISLFSGLIAPIFEQIKSLQLRNRNLRQTRDMLLPKLISGEVDVSELDICVGSEAK